MFSAETRDSALSRRNAVLDRPGEHNRKLNIDAHYALQRVTAFVPAQVCPVDGACVAACVRGCRV